MLHPATISEMPANIKQPEKIAGNQEPIIKGENFARAAATQTYHSGLRKSKQAEPERVLSTLLWLRHGHQHALL